MRSKGCFKSHMIVLNVQTVDPEFDKSKESERRYNRLVVYINQFFKINNNIATDLGIYVKNYSLNF